MTKLAPCASAVVLLAAASAVSAQQFPKDLTPEAIALWAPGHTTLKPGELVSIGGGRLVAVVDRRPDPTDPTLVRVTVRTEIVEAAAAKTSGGLSEGQDLVLDCRLRKAKAGPMRVHAQRNLGGAAHVQPGWDQWTGAEPSSVLGRIIEAGCRQATAADPLLGAAFAKPATVAPPTPVASSADLPPLGAVAPPAVAAAGAGPASAAAVPAPPEPAPEPQAPEPPTPPPPPPPPAPQEEVAPAAAAAPAAPPPRSGLRNLFAQIAAAGSQADAESAIAKARADLPDVFGDRPSSVESTVVAGQTFYRALFGGFASVDEAKAVCQAVKVRGHDCLLRVK